jgi:molybdopterin converting factor small subunit
MTIIAFGQVAEITGSSFILKDVQDTNELKFSLEKTYPVLQNMEYAIAVNKELIKINTELNDAFTVALLPPFSGG